MLTPIKIFGQAGYFNITLFFYSAGKFISMCQSSQWRNITKMLWFRKNSSHFYEKSSWFPDVWTSKENPCSLQEAALVPFLLCSEKIAMSSESLPVYRTTRSTKNEQQPPDLKTGMAFWFQCISILLLVSWMTAKDVMFFQSQMDQRWESVLFP